MRKALSPSSPRQRNYYSANQPSQLTINHQKLPTQPQPQDRDVQVQIIPDPPVVSNNIEVQLKQLTETIEHVDTCKPAASVQGNVHTFYSYL